MSDSLRQDIRLLEAMRQAIVKQTDHQHCQDAVRRRFMSDIDKSVNGSFHSLLVENETYTDDQSGFV